MMTHKDIITSTGATQVDPVDPSFPTASPSKSFAWSVQAWSWQNVENTFKQIFNQPLKVQPPIDFSSGVPNFAIALLLHAHHQSGSSTSFEWQFAGSPLFPWIFVSAYLLVSFPILPWLVLYSGFFETGNKRMDDAQLRSCCARFRLWARVNRYEFLDLSPHNPLYFNIHRAVRLS